MITDFSPKQEEYILHPPARINLLYGSVSSGKTVVSLFQWALFVKSMPEDSTFIMVGKTLTALKHNCLVLLEELVGQENFSFSTSQKSSLLYGRRVWLEGANDERAESKIRGLTVSGAYVDELTQIPRDFFYMLLSRLRTDGARLFATTNPDTPTHWVYTEVLNNPAMECNGVKFLLTDNPFLPPDYVESIQKEYSGVFFRRFIQGEWVRAEGVIYKQFADAPEAYALKQVPPLRMLIIGVDFGGNKSAHAFVATGITEDWGICALKSRRMNATGVSVEGMIRGLGAFIEAVQRQFGRVDGVYCDSAEQTIINSIRARFPDLAIYGSVKNPILDRIRAVDLMMSQNRFGYVPGQCETLVNALCTAVWDSKAAGDVRLDDGTSDIDTLDAFEYSWEFYIRQLTARGQK